MIDKVATLRTHGKNYSIFQVGDISIKFYTSPNLKRYCRIIKWRDNGYIEYLVEFYGMAEPVEDSIDLAFIAGRLHLPQDIFKGIKEVKFL